MVEQLLFYILSTCLVVVDLSNVFSILLILNIQPLTLVVKSLNMFTFFSLCFCIIKLCILFIGPCSKTEFT